MTNAVTLVVPSVALLGSYVAALERGWSPDNVRGKLAADEQLAAIGADPAAFVCGLDDPEGTGPAIMLPDGTTTPRLPSLQRWIWDGEFCGSIGFRWQRGTSELPPQVLGHIGFAIVPWKRGRGHARQGLALMLEEARMRSMTFIELTTAPDNVASQRVILSQGGVLVERFTKDAAYGGGEALRYRIKL